jgi:hypothetical protein
MNKLKRPWGLTLVAVLLLFLGSVALVASLAPMLEGRYARGAGFLTQGAVIITTGILILLHHKEAVKIARVCAILFTLGCVVHGLSILDLAQVALVWFGYRWYRSWRIRQVTPPPTVNENVAAIGSGH